jgi:hypothetical protein
MTQKRYNQIKSEAVRRLELWIQHSSFDEMSIGGSLMRFNMSLGLLGYPFEKEKWMIDFNKFITEDEFDSEQYDEITYNLFKIAENGIDRLPK